MTLFISVAHAEEAEPTWLANAFEDFGDLTFWGWLLLAVLLVGGALLYRKLRGKASKTVWTPSMLALGAVCMALSSVLSLIKVFSLPQGGSITAASMLPMILFAYAYGAGPGLSLGAIYGLLQFILKPSFYSFPQMLLDYPIAFGLLGLAGCFSKCSNTHLGLALGSIVACAGRLLASTLSGGIFFAAYAPEGLSPMVYALGYNAAYMVPECIICAALAVLAGSRLLKELKKVK